MAKHPDQFMFDFQPEGAADPQLDLAKGAETTRADSSAVLYCFADRRASRLAKEATAHFSAILGLVAHIK
jgi:hypothetical protein